MQTIQSDSFQDIREAVRDLCQQFAGDYFRKIDEALGYPETFVDALTNAGWLSCADPARIWRPGTGLEAIGHGMTVRPMPNMVNHETNELFFDNLEIPAENLIGEEGQGFKYILDGRNAERTLIAAECIGDGYRFVDKVTACAKERIVFGRPIGQNQGAQFPVARSFVAERKLKICVRNRNDLPPITRALVDRLTGAGC